MHFSYTLDDLKAVFQNADVAGSCSIPATGIAALKEAGQGDLSFLGNMKYHGDVAASKASYLLLPRDYAGEPPPEQVFLRVDNPSMALALLCRKIEASLWRRPAPGVHPSAVVSPTAKISASAHIGPFCIVGDDAVIGENTVLVGHNFVGRAVQIGDDCMLFDGVKILDLCVVGNRVRLQAGAVVGSDGFGYETVAGVHEKVPQIGIVQIEDDVEIGANTTVDRARFDRTLVGRGSKIDNLVQIGHNVRMGRGCIVCAQTGVSGSAILEDYAVLGGQVGIVGHLRIGKGAQIGAQSGVNHSVPDGGVVRGTPAMPYMQEQRAEVLRRRLPELYKRVSKIEETLSSQKKS